MLGFCLVTRERHSAFSKSISSHYAWRSLPGCTKIKGAKRSTQRTGRVPSYASKVRNTSPARLGSDSDTEKDISLQSSNHTSRMSSRPSRDMLGNSFSAIASKLFFKRSALAAFSTFWCSPGSIPYARSLHALSHLSREISTKHLGKYKETDTFPCHQRYFNCPNSLQLKQLPIIVHHCPISSWLFPLALHYG